MSESVEDLRLRLDSSYEPKCDTCGGFNDEAHMSQPHLFEPDKILILSKEEVKAVYRIIKNEWIDRDDDGAMSVSDKISKFVRQLD